MLRSVCNAVLRRGQALQRPQCSVVLEHAHHSRYACTVVATPHNGVSNIGSSSSSIALFSSSNSISHVTASIGQSGVRWLHSTPETHRAKSKKKKKTKTKKLKVDQELAKTYYTKINLGQHQALYEPPAEDAETTWTPESRRVGAITLKAGMTADWDTWGVRHPLTALMLEDVQVVQAKQPEETNGYYTLQVGGGSAKQKKTTMPMQGHFYKAGVRPKRKLVEFHVTEDAMLPPGTRITAQHFVPGQFVDVTGTTKGKGTQGVMKRWGFGGQGSSHGNTKSHRSPGSIGAGQDPGRVYKGKKMAGRMGGDQRTTECLQVYKIDIKRNIVYVKGAVPGFNGSYVKVRDSLRKPHKTPPPFPTHKVTQDDVQLIMDLREGKKFDSPQQARLKRAKGIPYEREPPYEIVMQPQGWDPFGIHDWEEASVD